MPPLVEKGLLGLAMLLGYTPIVRLYTDGRWQQSGGSLLDS